MTTAATLTAPSTPDLTDLSVNSEEFRVIRIDRRGITICGESRKWVSVESLTDLVDALVDTDNGSSNALTTAQFRRRLAVIDRSPATHVTTGDYVVVVDRRLRGVAGTWVRFGFAGRGIVRVPCMADLRDHKVAAKRADGKWFTAVCKNFESDGSDWVSYWIDGVMDSVA